jgi:hypothetical protein
MSENFWTGLQLDYDAAKAKETLGATLAKIKPWHDQETPARS